MLIKEKNEPLTLERANAQRNRKYRNLVGSDQGLKKLNLPGGVVRQSVKMIWTGGSAKGDKSKLQKVPCVDFVFILYFIYSAVSTLENTSFPQSL